MVNLDSRCCNKALETLDLDYARKIMPMGIKEYRT